MKTKAELRREAAQKRSRMQPEEREKASALIAQRLFSMKEWQEAERVFLYYGCGDEVKTEEIIDSALSSGKQVFLPKVTSSEKMVFIRVTSRAEGVIPGAYGIPEPEDKGLYEEDPPDLIVIPCVAVDEKGSRIGHGKGYYDRWLRGHEELTRVCLAFECQIVDCFRPDDTDIRMDAVLTEKRLFTVESAEYERTD